MSPCGSNFAAIKGINTMSGIRLIIIVFLIACAYALTACGGSFSGDSDEPIDRTDTQHIPTVPTKGNSQ